MSIYFSNRYQKRIRLKEVHGAELGSAFGPVGSFAGGFLGSVRGGIVGSKVGKVLSKGVGGKKYEPNDIWTWPIMNRQQSLKDFIMERNKRTFEEYVRDAILSNKEFNILQINDLQSIKDMVLLRHQYSYIVELAKSGQIESIKKLGSNDNKGSEYLNIYLFNDQNEQKYIATIYDSDELWQNPEIWDIFRLETA